MAKSIRPEMLGKEIQKQLKLLHQDTVEKVDDAGERAIQKIVKLTKATAPKRFGDFRRAITYKKVTADWTECSKFIWGVKAPHYRRTHLLVHGHPTVNGNRVPGDPFLEDAMAKVLPEYEKEVEEALKE